jgi:hydroxymethylbilane synthase
VQSAAIRIGTRGSPLALAQAEMVRALLAEGGDEAEIVPIRTTGDRITDRPLAEAGGKGLFTKEIDEALLAGRVDIAVHSAKDLPTWLPEGLVIAGCLPRADVRDAFISPHADRLVDLPKGARLGTASLRRQALALRLRPDLEVVNLRGNVETRLKRIADGLADATLLAAAGLARLGLLERADDMMDLDQWLPATGQGVIAVTAREEDGEMRGRLALASHHETFLALAAERAFLAVLDGSCRTPIGAYSTREGETLTLLGEILSPDGAIRHAGTISGPAAEAERLGTALGQQLVAEAGADFFRQFAA